MAITEKFVAAHGTAGGGSLLPHTDSFVRRHIGPSPEDQQKMLDLLGLSSLDELVQNTVPESIRTQDPLRVGPGTSEYSVLAQLREIAAQNKVCRSFIGMGYHDCVIPPVIQRNILENPGWYTQYTPYQAEIAQGRLEALLNFQTMVADLTALDIANASLLDEGTAAAEAMMMSRGLAGNDAEACFVSDTCHPQTAAVVRTRAEAMGIGVITGDHRTFDFSIPVFGVVVGYPATDGTIFDYAPFVEQAHSHGALVTVVADLLSLALLRAPGEFGADICAGSTQRFGVPLGFGGPHAGFFATLDRYKRHMPGRLIGVSKDSAGQPAYRLALQTREQHIRRDRATSNICTAQVLLAVMASMYAVYHGPEGIRRIAARVRRLTAVLAAGLKRMGCKAGPDPWFDTLTVALDSSRCAEVAEAARAYGINLRIYPDSKVGISLNETTTEQDVLDLIALFGPGDPAAVELDALVAEPEPELPEPLRRKSPYLTHPVFNRYHSETEMLRYIHGLQSKDLSLTTAMIPLGSCTMKLNAAVEMFPVSWPEFSRIHPFVPAEQTRGYQLLFRQLEYWLCDITGFDAVSLQPNAGSQGEYSGLLVIRKYHQERGEGGRNVCLIPQSAHGTNPASAVMAGLKVVVVACDEDGNIDLDHLRAKADAHAARLAALMVTYPSTHGVFEEAVKEICGIIHSRGGQVYMDGANLNAQVGLCRPAEMGADVCHLNLHKTFSIPHGGGGPGMGPIGVKAHLAPFLPGHPVIDVGGKQAIGPVSSGPWGSPSILPISWTYIALMGSDGLTEATKVAILNANYVARRLEPHYPVLYKGSQGMVAHECILDLRPLKKTAGVEVEDVAKRLMDYGFHAPTVSFPVAGTLMVEPTESESLYELDRFCDAMIAIRNEIREIEDGQMPSKDNPLKNAPHTARTIASASWAHPYSRERAVFPDRHTRERKFWPAVGRIDNVYGDRNLFCTCLPVEGEPEER